MEACDLEIQETDIQQKTNGIEDSSSVTIKSAKDSSGEEQESQIKTFHNWVESLCDPEEYFCEKLQNQMKQDWPLSSTAEEDPDLQLKLRVGQVSISGIKGPRELGDIAEEEEEEMSGPVNIRKSDGTVFEGNYDQGLPHGFFRHLNDFGDLEFFGCFNRGALVGVCWRSLPGGGFLISRSWDFTEDRLTYLYPDCRTGLVGSFRGSDVEIGQQAEIVGCSACGPQGLILKPLMSSPQGDFFSFDAADSTIFCRAALQRDPYEALFVEVRKSNIINAGEGLFALRDMEAGTIISFYNGIKVKPGQQWEKPTPYRMLLDETSDLDLPDEVTNLENYRATLAHKVCHSFKPNAETDVFYHPRFGLIRCIATLTRIVEGEEILINYDYNLSTAPAWYKVAWAKHQKVVRGLPDWKSALFINNIQIGSRRSSWSPWLTEEEQEGP